MKLFQKMLVASAAVSLIAPLGALASDYNIEGMNSYASSKSSSKKQRKFSSKLFTNELATLEKSVQIVTVVTKVSFLFFLFVWVCLFDLDSLCLCVFIFLFQCRCPCPLACPGPGARAAPEQGGGQQRRHRHQHKAAEDGPGSVAPTWSTPPAQRRANPTAAQVPPRPAPLRRAPRDGVRWALLSATRIRAPRG